jgi:hypothetical protein
MEKETKFIEIGANVKGLPVLINVSEIVTVRHKENGDNQVVLRAKDEQGINITIETKVPLHEIFKKIKDSQISS